MGSRHPGESGLRGAQGEEGKWTKSGRGRGRDRDAYHFDRIHRMDMMPGGESSHTETRRAQRGTAKLGWRKWRGDITSDLSGVFPLGIARVGGWDKLALM